MYQEYPVNFIFYYNDPQGKFRSIYNTPVSRFATRNAKEFHKELQIQSGKTLYESDVNPIFRCFEENYKGKDSPKLHTAFFDIEVDFDAERGFSKPEDPFNPITAVSVYLDWLDQLVTLVIPPRSMSAESANEIASEFPNTFVFTNEKELLNTFLNLIDDADVLSGWNSEGYDIPYTIQRITRVLSKDDTRRLCLWGQFPRQREFERFGASHITFDLIGRVHMDYMQLYRRYTYEERHSYSLDAIGEYEDIGSKTKYEGTLDQLYNRDWKKFIEYNRQDTMLIVKLDKKLRFLDLANTLAHENTVLLQTTMGAVAVTDQAIINEAHERNLVVPNRKERLTDETTQAAGAYVAYPKKGIHEWVGSIDIKSLYPSTIRALNMAPETIIGQLRPIMTDHLIQDRMKSGMSFAAAWEGLFATLEYTAVMESQRGTELTIDWEDGTEEVYSAAEVWKMIFDSNRPWILSANGTIFTYEVEGVVPGLLKRWYSERQLMQEKANEAYGKNDAEFEYWDKRQLVKKINLNSLYGALLNPGSRFFDQRIGQSTTLTGRIIAKHMDAFVNECVTGTYDHAGEAIIYGDSVTGDTLIDLGNGSRVKIEDLFDSIHYKVIQDSGKEHAIPTAAESELTVLGFNATEDEAVYGAINYVMRHKTNKQLYKVTMDDGTSVSVTEDHSLMVDRDGFLVEVKPTDLLDHDLIISIMANTKRQRVAKVEKIKLENDRYVYDISMKDQDPFFFGNGHLLHNTDSCYFSVWPVLQKEIEQGTMPWSKEICIELYNKISDQVNNSFPEFMERACHVPRERGTLISGGRELVASKSLFIAKKRYAVLYIDKENKRFDVNGEPGKIKAMGLDLKRSDTPVVIQNFLSEILTEVLTGTERESIIEKIREFKYSFSEFPGWQKGTPKRVNNLTMYGKKEEREGKTNMPGHVRAALNWNRLRQINADNYSMQIVDGMKTVVCKLKSNPLGWTSIGYPTDEMRLPQWFKDLPFDDAEMETTVVDQKINNLLGVLNWDLDSHTNTKNTFQTLFEF